MPEDTKKNNELSEREQAIQKRIADSLGALNREQAEIAVDAQIENDKNKKK